MRLQVKGKNVEVSDSDPRVRRGEARKLDRQLHEPTQVELELRGREEPVDRRQPHRRGDGLDEGADAAGPGGVAAT